jgi:hypothetical protein
MYVADVLCSAAESIAVVDKCRTAVLQVTTAKEFDVKAEFAT